MKQIAVFGLLVLLACAGSSTVSAQDSAATPAQAEGEVSVISFDVASPAETKFGFIRTTIAPGGSYSLSAGSAPAVRYVENGTLTVESDDLTIVGASSATPAAASAGVVSLEAGTAFVVAEGGSAELRNERADPVNVFDFLSATDAAVADETDVTHLVLAQQDYQLPAGTVTVTLARTTLDSGEQFEWPADPATTMLYPLDRADAFQLTGQGFNRGQNVIEIYALTIMPT